MSARAVHAPWSILSMLTVTLTHLRGVLAMAILVVHTTFWALPIYVVTLLKLAIPWKPWRKLCSRVMTRLSELWVSTNNVFLRLLLRTTWDIQGLEGLRTDQSYLVNSNHQSWNDIVVLQRVFSGHIPFLRFFIKQELIWVPLFGIVWWALDMPFMKRYPREVLEKHPELRGKDVEATRTSCERLRDFPVSIINFLEGTRFTPEKHRAQASPHRHLLRPRAGGIAFVLGAMGDQLTHLLDVTILYPQGRPTLWEFIGGKVSRIVIRVNQRPIPPEFLQRDYATDVEFRTQFQAWVGELWSEKDALIDQLLQESRV
jgi:1-acyl-sn-glycerol-3-phosphate acyltransferase